MILVGLVDQSLNKLPRWFRKAIVDRAVGNETNALKFQA